jgi:vacuolar-type H+-ATPase subunit I/STV1
MYAVVRYFNYRKEVSFSILKTFYNFKNADKYALKCAQNDFGNNVVKGVSQQWVDVDDEIEGYTANDGYGEFVYTIMYIPEPKDIPDKSESDIENNVENITNDVQNIKIENEIDEETQMEFKKQNNGKYEWGFDLTDFNENDDENEDENENENENENEKKEENEKENKGVIKFKELLNKFDLIYNGTSEGGRGFLWKNNKIILVTGNNPISGIYYSGSGSRNIEKGYLSYVGVSCNSLKDLKDFIEEFRSKATYIKEEANERIYI